MEIDEGLLHELIEGLKDIKAENSLINSLEPLPTGQVRVRYINISTILVIK